MAKGFKSGGRDWKPGQSGNLKGGVGVTKEIKEVRRLGQIELERLLNKLVYLRRDELQAVISNPLTPMIEVMVASVIVQSAKKGDQVRLEFLLTRLIGKVKDEVHMHGNLSVAPQVVLTLPANGRTKEEVEILALEAELG